MAVQFHELVVSKVSPQGDGAVALTLDIPDNLRKAFRFTPGQYLTLRAEIEGKDERRSYSICSPLSMDCLKVGVKQLEGGVFSTFANALKEGDRLRVMTPQGRFTLEVAADKKRNILLIAAGSGITPILSIAQSVLEEETESTVTLIYGNRKTDSIMFREELEALKDRYMERFSLFHVLSREDQDVDIVNGRIDEAKLQALTDKGIIAPAGYDGVYLCGPQEMIEACSAKLISLGADQSDIHFELFTPADGSQPAAKQVQENRQDAAGSVTVEAILDGTRRRFQMDGKQSTVLGAAHEAGIELPFSCAGGMCCTCRCQVFEGKAEMDVNYSLEPWEIEAGFVLACQARPKTGKLVLDFDTV